MTDPTPSCSHRDVLGLDPVRVRCTIPDDLIGAVGVQVLDTPADALAETDPAITGADVPALVRRSGDDNGGDHRRVHFVLGALLAPTVVTAVNVVVRRVGPAGESTDRFWIGETGATHGEREECGCWTLRSTAAPYVPHALAELAGIGPGRALTGAPIVADAGDLAALEQALVGGDPTAAVAELESRGHSRDAARALVLIATTTQAKISISATWAGREGVATHTVDHLVTGDTRWRVESDDDDVEDVEDDGGRTFVPLGPTEAFADIAAVLPASEELRLPAAWGVRPEEAAR